MTEIKDAKENLDSMNLEMFGINENECEWPSDLVYPQDLEEWARRQDRKLKMRILIPKFAKAWSGVGIALFLLGCHLIKKGITHGATDT